MGARLTTKASEDSSDEAPETDEFDLSREGDLEESLI
jgi:hypothetical protein